MPDHASWNSNLKRTLVNMFDLTVWKRENQIINFFILLLFSSLLIQNVLNMDVINGKLFLEFLVFRAQKICQINRRHNSFLLSLIFSLLLIQNVLSMDVINGKLSMMDESILKLGVGDLRVRVRIQPNLKILEIQLLDMLPQMEFIGSTTYSVWLENQDPPAGKSLFFWNMYVIKSAYFRDCSFLNIIVHQKFFFLSVSVHCQNLLAKHKRFVYSAIFGGVSRCKNWEQVSPWLRLVEKITHF